MSATTSACGIGGIIGSDLEVYGLVSVNGRPARVEKGESVRLGPASYNGHSCNLETAGGKFDLYTGEKSYSAFISLVVRCPDGALSSASASDEGTYEKCDATLYLSTLRRGGLDISRVLVRSDELATGAVLDGSTLNPATSGTIVLGERIPVTLVYRRTI
jgi:hypothetical protein